MKDYKKEINNLRIENELLIRQLQSLQLQLANRTLLSGDYVPIIETLPYRLGKLMIGSNANISSLSRLPKKLRIMSQENSLNGDYIENIVSIDDLLNSKHLSYRLGLVYLKNNYSIWSRSIRPWLLYKEVKRFRKEKARKNND